MLFLQANQDTQGFKSLNDRGVYSDLRKRVDRIHSLQMNKHY